MYNIDLLSILSVWGVNYEYKKTVALTPLSPHQKKKTSYISPAIVWTGQYESNTIAKFSKSKKHTHKFFFFLKQNINRFFFLRLKFTDTFDHVHTKWVLFLDLLSCHELQWRVALFTLSEWFVPGPAVTLKTVVRLLAARSVKTKWTVTSRDKNNNKSKIRHWNIVVALVPTTISTKICIWVKGCYVVSQWKRHNQYTVSSCVLWVGFFLWQIKIKMTFLHKYVM